MRFIDFTSESQIDEIKERSAHLKGVLIFKHSTRCAISSMAFSRFSRGWDIEENEIPVYFLDILNYRRLSDQIAVHFNVQHESPQLLYIKDGKCTYHPSHNSISPSVVKDLAYG